MIISRDKNDQNLPQVIDLFSGCGGLSLGFLKAGYNLAGGVDFYQAAVDTLNANLHVKFGEEPYHEHQDVTKLKNTNPQIKNQKNKKNLPISQENKEDESIKELKGIIQPSESGYIVIGGPPCQAYSQAGKGKIKSLGKTDTDKRGDLWQSFLNIIIGDPMIKGVVMENVPEATNHNGISVPHEVCDELEANGFSARWSILNAADYGVPQTRERIIVIAIRKPSGDFQVNIEFPPKTHRPIDHETFNLKSKQKIFQENPNLPLPSLEDINNKNTYFIPPKSHENSLPTWVTVQQALSDLPSILPTSQHTFKFYEPQIALPYKSPPTSDYQRQMRIPLNHFFEDQNDLNTKIDDADLLSEVTGHSIRKTQRDFQIFERMQQGDNYLDAHKIAMDIFEDTLKEQGLEAQSKDDQEQIEKIKKSIVPPYNLETFSTRWKKLKENRPSWTLVAHLSEDTYSHLHHQEPRGISVREAARLQSFPDDFTFPGAMSDAFKQIGNAVPPLMAYHIAKQIKKIFKDLEEEELKNKSIKHD